MASFAWVGGMMENSVGTEWMGTHMLGRTCTMKNYYWVLLWMCIVLCGDGVAIAEPIDDYNTALKFYEQKRWSFAVRGFEEFLKQSPNHQKSALARLYLGQSLTHSQKYEAARKVFRDFLETYPDHKDAALASYRIGESSYFLGEYESASKELLTFVQAYPEHELATWGWQYLGESRLQSQDAAGAVQAFDVVLNSTSKTADKNEAMFYLARAYEALHKADEAAAAYRKVAATDHARAAEALFGLASADYDAKRYDEAASQFKDLAERFSKSSLAPTSQLNAGFALYQAGKYEVAEQQFNLASQTPANTDTATFWVGMSRKSRSEWMLASQTFQALAARLTQGDLAEKTHYHWADCELRQDHFAPAKKLFLDVVEKWPNSSVAEKSLYSAADTALREQQFEEAIRLAEQFQTRYQKSALLPTSELLLGKALMARGDSVSVMDLTQAQADFQQASMHIQKVLSAQSTPRIKALARIQLARVEKRLNHPDKVIEALSPILDSIDGSKAGGAEFVEALPTLGEALLDVGQPAQAADVLSRTLQLLPVDSPQRSITLMKLAEVQASLTKWGEMDATLDQLAKADSTGVLVSQSAYANADRAITKKEWDAARQLLERIISQGDKGKYYIVALNDLGLVYSRQGQPDLAAQTYQRVIDSQPTDREVLASASYHRGISLEQAAGEDVTRLAAAQQALENTAQTFAIPADKTLPDAIEQKLAIQAVKAARRAALISVKRKDLEAADRLWLLADSQIPKLQPADQEVERWDAMLFEWAGSLFNGGNSVRADELLTRLYTDFPTSEYADDARLFVAQGHDQAGRAEPARQLYKTFENDTSVTESTRLEALKSWMNLEVRLKNWAESERLSTLVMQTFANTPLVYDARFNVGEAQLQRGDFTAAAKSLAELRSDPQLPANVSWRPDLELLWAEIRIRSQEYADARSVLNALIETKPAAIHIDQAHEKLGQIDLREALFDQARQHWEQVTNSPASAKRELAAKCQLAIAESYLAQKNHEEAIRSYQKLYVNYKLPDYQAPALLQMGKCEATIKDWAGAKTSLETLIKEFPQSTQAQQAAQDLEIVQRHLPASDAP